MWRLPFRLPLTSPSGSEPVADPIDPEFEQLVAGALRSEPASDTLRARVAEACTAALAAPQPTHLLTHSRPKLKYALALTAVLLILLPFLANRGRDAAYAEQAPTAGQLALLDGNGNPTALCPLKHTDVQADVEGYVARVTVEQRFHNPSDKPVEAIYTFPLPEDAAVDDMTIRIGNRLIVGDIKRREEARRIYEDAKAAGQTAALLDQERPNIFTQSLANLMPGADVAVRISYVNLLKYEDGGYEFVYPMVVGPRFIPGSGGYQAPGLRGEPSPARQVEPEPGTTAVVTDADKITPPITPKGTRAGHDISVTVRLNAGMPIQSVDSTLHRVDVDRDGENRATAQLRDQKSIPNKDFILRYAVADQQIRSAVLASKGPEGDDSGYFTLMLQPPALPNTEKLGTRELVFVIDQTGSQSGWPIQKAKETMRYLIRNMNPDDTFQLLGFNTEVFPCFDAPVRNTPENVARALRFLDPLQGEGGTDILLATDYALQMPLEAGRRRLICFLTDGYVGDDMQIIDYVRKHRDRAHMFPFGMGNGVNRMLLEGMAREGQGKAQVVTLQSSAEEAAARFYRQVAKPLVTNLTVDWNGLPVADVYPTRIPDLFVDGRPIILKGRYTQSGEGEITLRGELDGRPWSHTMEVSLPATRSDHSPLPSLWAREKIEELQTSDYLGLQTGNPNEEIKQQIIGVALDYRLMSQYTSFVAVEQRVVNLGGKQRTVDVPVEMPEGVAYEGIFGDEDKEFEGRRFAVGGTNLNDAEADQNQSTQGYFKPKTEEATLNALEETPKLFDPVGRGETMAWPQVIEPAEEDPSNNSRLLSAPPGASATVANPVPQPGLPTSAAAPPVIASPGAKQRQASPASPLATLERRKTLPRSASSAGQTQRVNPFTQNVELQNVLTATPSPSRPRPMPRRYQSRTARPGSTPADGLETSPALKDARRARARLARKANPSLKLAPPLRAASKTPAGDSVVQIWVSNLPKDGLAKLKALGFELADVLTPGKLLIGTAPAEKLKALAALDWVLYIEPPRFK
ncbi:MAG: VIT domain-containing protein [Actinomycetota bacterium]